MTFASGEYAGGSFASTQSVSFSGRTCTANISELNDTLNSDATNDSTTLTIECAYSEQNDVLVGIASYELQVFLVQSDQNDLLSCEVGVEINCIVDLVELNDVLSGGIIASSRVCDLSIFEQNDSLLSDSDLSLANGTWYPRESVTIIWTPKNEFA